MPPLITKVVIGCEGVRYVHASLLHIIILSFLNAVLPSLIINFVPGGNNLSNKNESHQDNYVLLQMALAAPSGSDHFLEDLFGMPTILWRVLQRAGYTDKPVYVWDTAPRGGQLVTLVQLSIPALGASPVWHG